VTLAPKSWRATVLWIGCATLFAFLLYRFWVLPTAGTPFISDMGALDPETHSEYEIDLDQIHRFWPIQIVPPSRFRDPQHGIMTYSWLAAEHKARSAVAVSVWFLVVGYAGFKHFRSCSRET
jgi:hypothetical protein